MRVELYQGSRREWDAFISESGDATYGHLWSWREIVEQAYGFDSFYVVARDQTGRLTAAAPFVFVDSRLYGRELTSMPYIDYGGVCHSDSLSLEQQSECDRSIFEFARQLGVRLRVKRIHVRSPRPCESPFQVSTEKVTQHLPLARSVQEQFKRLPSERRNRLRHCKRAGLVTEIHPADDARALKEFHWIYTSNMRNLGSPTHSMAFFKQVCLHLAEKIQIITIRHKEKAIAGALGFEFRGWKSLPWSGATVKAKAVYGSNELYWAAIKHGIETGCHTFDFGRSSIGSGIFEFKRQWGPQPFQPYWCTFYVQPRALAPKQRAGFELASRIWKRVPVTLAYLLGPQLRKGISN